jgi:hypothetical protein
MAVDFGSAIGRAWKYSTDKKRLALLSAFFIILGLALLAPILFLYKNIALESVSALAMVQGFAGLFVIALIGCLVYIHLLITYTHNYANRKSLGASSTFAKKIYLRFLAVFIALAIISGIASSVPLVGIIVSIVVGLLFFFVYQEVAVNNSKFTESFSRSYELFNRNKLDVLVTFLLSAILSIFILIVFALPLLAVGAMTLVSGINGGGFVAAFMANAPLFVITGMILAVGFALACLVSNSIRTDIYLQLKKRKIGK